MRGISGKRNRKTKPSYADGAASPPCQHHLRRGARNWAFVFCGRDAADMFFTPPRCWLRPPENHKGIKMVWIAIGACFLIGVGVPSLILWKMSKEE